MGTMARDPVPAHRYAAVHHFVPHVYAPYAAQGHYTPRHYHVERLSHCTLRKRLRGKAEEELLGAPRPGRVGVEPGHPALHGVGWCRRGPSAALGPLGLLVMPWRLPGAERPPDATLASLPYPSSPSGRSLSQSPRPGRGLEGRGTGIRGDRAEEGLWWLPGALDGASPCRPGWTAGGIAGAWAGG